jgi:hypothetical protein
VGNKLCDRTAGNSDPGADQAGCNSVEGHTHELRGREVSSRFAVKVGEPIREIVVRPATLPIPGPMPRPNPCRSRNLFRHDRRRVRGALLGLHAYLRTVNARRGRTRSRASAAASSSSRGPRPRRSTTRSRSRISLGLRNGRRRQGHPERVRPRRRAHARAWPSPVDALGTRRGAAACAAKLINARFRLPMRDEV